MALLKRISLSFLVSLGVYGLLLVPWPGLMAGYGTCFRGVANVLFSSVGGTGTVTFELFGSEAYAYDTTIVMRNRNLPPRAKASFDIKCLSIGYRPAAFLIALVLATPVPWSRRWWALLWGLLLVNLFVAFRVWLVLLDFFSDATPLAAFTLGPFLKNALTMAKLFLFIDPAMHYIVPAFIWLLVTFRRGDLRAILTVSPPLETKQVTVKREQG